MFLLLQFISWELSPEIVELGVVLLAVVLAINNNDIFLVAFSSLESPVERPSHKIFLINEHKFVMHVIFLLWITSGWNSSIRASLSVSSLSLHSFVISDKSDSNTSLVCSNYLVSQIIISEWENTQIDRFFSHRDVFNHFLDISHIWEEESILVSWLRSIVSRFEFSNHLSQSLQDFLILIWLHLSHGDGEKMIHSRSAVFLVVLLI